MTDTGPLWTFSAPLVEGSGVLSDQQDRKNRTTHMRRIGSPRAGQSTLVSRTTGEVTFKPVRTGDDEKNPDLIIIQGGREFTSTDPWLFSVLEPYGAHYVEDE
jgi:hypothetical protein